MNKIIHVLEVFYPARFLFLLLTLLMIIFNGMVLVLSDTISHDYHINTVLWLGMLFIQTFFGASTVILFL